MTSKRIAYSDIYGNASPLQVATMKGVSYSAAYNWQRYGVPVGKLFKGVFAEASSAPAPTRPPKPESPKPAKRERAIARANEWARLYIGGSTLQEIAEQNGVCREYIRQQIKKHCGLTRNDGGIHVRATERKNRYAAHLSERLKRSIPYLGCTKAEALTINQGCPLREKRTPVNAYYNQKRAAERDSVEWGMTLPVWWEMWTVSGKWGFRGRGYGYVMHRKDSSGPFSVSNVEIVTGAQNASNSFIRTPAAVRTEKARQTYVRQDFPEQLCS